MDWLWIALPILVAVQLWLMYRIGRKRGYEDGYDVGYAEASRYYCQGGKLPTKTLADWKRDSDAGGRAIAHTVTGSEHGDLTYESIPYRSRGGFVEKWEGKEWVKCFPPSKDIAYPVGTERLDDMGRVYRWTGREWEQIAGFGLEMEMPRGDVKKGGNNGRAAFDAFAGSADGDLGSGSLPGLLLGPQAGLCGRLGCGVYLEAGY